MLSLESLSLLDVIAKQGSFAAAAQLLGKAPSAITYSVRQLEEQLDVLLFDRAGHKAKLTACGDALLKEGRLLLAASDALERKVKRLATGWETELRIVVDNILPFERMFPLIEQFDQLEAPTQLRFSTEVLSGSWEALISGRADLLVGAAYGAPDAAGTNTGLMIEPLTRVSFVFAISPTHPLAALDEPLDIESIKAFRAIAVGDTSRSLPSRSYGLQAGQAVLTVPSLQAKLNAHIAGLGCGWLPIWLAKPAIDAGQLVEKRVHDPARSGKLHYAWRRGTKGKALAWWTEQLQLFDKHAHANKPR
jgi:DNA-binding transcriptional LysR family regulator